MKKQINFRINALQYDDILFNQNYYKSNIDGCALAYTNSNPTIFLHKLQLLLLIITTVVCTHTWVILSILPSQLSLSSYNGSLCVPMNIGSQCKWYPVRLPVWNTLTPGLGLALAHSLNLGTVWQSGHTFLWKVMAEPFLSIDTCCRQKKTNQSNIAKSCV